MTRDPPDKHKQLLNSTVPVFFEEMLRREGLKEAETSKEIFKSFLVHVQSRLEEEERIVASIGDDQVMEAFIKTICIQLYEEYAKRIRHIKTASSVAESTSAPNTTACEPKSPALPALDSSIPTTLPALDSSIPTTLHTLPTLPTLPTLASSISPTLPALDSSIPTTLSTLASSIPPPPPPPPPLPAVLGSFQPRSHKSNCRDFKAAHKLKIRTHRQVNSASLWALPHGDLIKEAHDSFPEADFLRLFCLPADKQRTTSTAGKPISLNTSSSASMAVICLLDTKRSNNISIALSRLKSIEEVCALMGKVEEADLLALSEDDLTALIKSEPTAQELKLLTEFVGPVDSLNFPEKVLHQFSLRPGLPWMLRAVRYMQKLPGWLDDCKRGLALLSAAYQNFLSSSAVLKLMLSARRLHELNNVIFGDGRPVQGIALEGLLEFARLESVDGSQLALAAYLTARLPELPKQLEMDLAAVLKEAIQVDWSGLGSLLVDIQTGLAHLQTPPSSDQLSRNFTAKRVEFVSEIEDAIIALSSAHAACAEEWKQVCIYFELDPTEYTPTDLFHLWNQILKQLGSCN